MAEYLAGGLEEKDSVLGGGAKADGVRETRFGAVEYLRHANKRFFKVSFVDRDVDGSERVVVVTCGDRGHAQYQRSDINWKMV